MTTTKSYWRLALDRAPNTKPNMEMAAASPNLTAAVFATPEAGTSTRRSDAAQLIAGLRRADPLGSDGSGDLLVGVPSAPEPPDSWPAAWMGWSSRPLGVPSARTGQGSRDRPEALRPPAAHAVPDRRGGTR